MDLEETYERKLTKRLLSEPDDVPERQLLPVKIGKVVKKSAVKTEPHFEKNEEKLSENIDEGDIN